MRMVPSLATNTRLTSDEDMSKTKAGDVLPVIGSRVMETFLQAW